MHSPFKTPTPETFGVPARDGSLSGRLPNSAANNIRATTQSDWCVLASPQVHQVSGILASHHLGLLRKHLNESIRSTNKWNYAKTDAMDSTVEHPTTTWEAMPEGNVFYRRLQLYSIPGKLPNLSDFIVAGCRNGGPIGACAALICKRQLYDPRILISPLLTVLQRSCLTRRR